VFNIEKVERIEKQKVYDIEIEPIYTSYCGKGKSKKSRRIIVSRTTCPVQ